MLWSDRIILSYLNLVVMKLNTVEEDFGED